MKTQLIGLCTLVLIGIVSCTETVDVKKEEASIKKLNSKTEQKRIAKVSSSTSKTSKKQIDKFPQPPPSVDDDYFILPHSSDDIPEIRDQEGDNYGVELIESPKEDRYSIENTEPSQLEVFSDPEEPAEFPGGAVAMKKFIYDNLIYPPLAIEMNLQGKCYVQFVVNIDGTLSNVKVMRGVYDCPECDKEAIRVVKAMPNWNPGKLESKVVRSYYTLPITFKMI